MNDLEELANDLEALEPLEKGKCVRCSNSVSTKGGRCASCLKKLKTNKKKPGHYLHEHKLADDALRRQDGKNGTTSHKSSGRGSRKSLISQVRSGYKKHGKGTTLSPDRKDNSKGYASGNTRMVPKKLNQGRHKVDSKKLKNWQGKVKKTDLSFEEFKTLMRVRAIEVDKEFLIKHIDEMTYERFVLLSKSEVSQGIKVEKEHTATIKQIIKDAESGKLKDLEEYLKDIAEDHIAEIKDYYTRLNNMEEQAQQD